MSACSTPASPRRWSSSSPRCSLPARPSSPSPTLPSELTPSEDRGFIPISIRSPQGATVDYTAEQIRKAEAIVQPFVDSGEVTNVFSTARGFGGGGFMFVTLAPWDERTRSQQEITADLNRKLQAIPGVQMSAFTANSLGIRGGGQGIQFAVTGNDYKEIADAATALAEAMQDDPAFSSVRLNYDTTQAQLSIDIDRERAADIGVPVATISAIIQGLLEGKDLGNFYIGDDPIEIHLEAPDGMIQDPSGLDHIQVRTTSGRMVPLSAFVTFKEMAVAPNLQRQDQRRAVPMTATLGEGVDLRSGMDRLQEIAATSLPAGMGIVYLGRSQGAQSGDVGRRPDLPVSRSSSSFSSSPPSSRASSAPSS